VITGFILNRLNVSITGLEAASGVHYFPRWTEVAVTLSIVAVGFLLFSLAVRYLNVMEKQVSGVRYQVSGENIQPVTVNLTPGA
jgi:Ni/Fe-hydrogenase subunit HybB-like protein